MGGCLNGCKHENLVVIQVRGEDCSQNLFYLLKCPDCGVSGYYQKKPIFAVFGNFAKSGFEVWHPRNETEKSIVA
jgi:hypothetical protein